MNIAIMIDDINMPTVDSSGAQPAIELLRQFCDAGFIYDRVQFEPIQISNATIIASWSPPEGGRYRMSARFTRHFHVLWIPPESAEGLKYIYKNLVSQFFS